MGPERTLSGLLGGRDECLTAAMERAEEGDRAAALVCARFHEGRGETDEAVLEFLRRAGEGEDGNPVARALCARHEPLGALADVAARLPVVYPRAVHPLCVLFAALALCLGAFLIRWGSDTPGFQYRQALQSLGGQDLDGAQALLRGIALNYPRSPWSRRAEASANVLEAWERLQAGAVAAARALMGKVDPRFAADLGGWYERVRTALARESAAAELMDSARGLEAADRLGEARGKYVAVVSRYRDTHAAPAAKAKLPALDTATTRCADAKAAMAERDWDRVIDLCDSIEQTGIVTCRTAALRAEAYEKQNIWSLAAAYWQQSWRIHNNDQARERHEAAQRIAWEHNKSIEFDAKGTLSGPGTARITMTVRNIGEFPVWGTRVRMVSGGHVCYDEVVIPRSEPLSPGESRTKTATVPTYGATSFSADATDTKKLPRRRSRS